MGFLEDLRQVDGVKYVKRKSGGTLRIDLFSREIPGREAEDIQCDLRKTSQRLSSRLDDAVKSGEIGGWSWVEKPQKQYRDSSPDSVQVSDRQGAGHKPSHYTVNLEGV
jgi:hypothetical protein